MRELQPGDLVRINRVYTNYHYTDAGVVTHGDVSYDWGKEGGGIGSFKFTDMDVDGAIAVDLVTAPSAHEWDKHRFVQLTIMPGDWADDLTEGEAARAIAFTKMLGGGPQIMPSLDEELEA